MAVDNSYLEFIVEQLSEFDALHNFGVTTKKMFGGVGIFCNGVMFGMIGGGKFRLRVDEENKPDYEAKGMNSYNPKKKGKGMPYWEVPVEVLEDKTQLTKWATKAHEAALRGKK